jgi:hypothetical protein
MIPCICIDDSNRPETIPISKWVKKGDPYTITYTCKVLPQGILAVSLYEKPLGPLYAPFEYFAARRFAVDAKDLEKLAELIALCSEEGNVNVDELMRELTVQEPA